MSHKESVSVSISEEEFCAIVEQHRQAVRSYLGFMIGGKHDVDDLTQETFLRAWRYLQRYRAHTSMRALLRAMARRVVCDWLRKKRTSLPIEALENADELIEQLECLDAAPDELAERAVRAARLRAALSRLPPEQREVVVRHYLNGCSMREIGNDQRVSIETVRSRNRLAISKLRSRLHK